MSYLTYPRLTFSGQFQANVSTLNNISQNYNPTVYSDISDMSNVALVWNPLGDGGWTFKDCVVTRVDYSPSSFATTSTEDPIVGQPVSAVKSADFPIAATLVDLDVQQQAVSEIWGLTLEIGGPTLGVCGDFTPSAFSSMWGQSIGAGAPRSSASASALYQSTLKNTTTQGDLSCSKLLKQLAGVPGAEFSVGFTVNAHNNNPPIYSFNSKTIAAMSKAGVPQAVLDKLTYLQTLSQGGGQPGGDLPTQAFTLYALKQQLTKDEYNANVDAIMSTTQQPYTGSTPSEFTWGSVMGSIGASEPAAPDFFVPSRMMNPQAGVRAASYAPFHVSDNGLDVTLSLSNSLATDLPGQGFSQPGLGDLWLVSFPNGKITPDNATQLVQIDYANPDFTTKQAGFVSYSSACDDLSQTPLGLLSIKPADGAPTKTVLLAEDPNGWYVRANQFVFRMNPGLPTTSENPSGETAKLDVHALQFGKPAPDGTQIELADTSVMTLGLGTGCPVTALTAATATKSVSGLPGAPLKITAPTSGGVASFTLTATNPGNPRNYINGQVYALTYQLTGASAADGYQPAPSDFVSIHIYDQEADGDAIGILGEYGRLYLVMSFLDEQKMIEGIDLRNMIKLLLEKPMTAAIHMPVTRDLSFADKQKIVSWIDALNNS
ncbi:MAG: hypothetical protein ACI9VS_000239 [Candidatus Binatia bacterium]|jgi:hypothetical protein